MFNFLVILSAFLYRACVTRVRFFLAFIVSMFGFIISMLFLPRSGSGARGLIKAPAGVRGLAPELFVLFLVFTSIYLPPFQGGLGGL